MGLNILQSLFVKYSMYQKNNFEIVFVFNYVIQYKKIRHTDESFIILKTLSRNNSK